MPTVLARRPFSFVSAWPKDAQSRCCFIVAPRPRGAIQADASRYPSPRSDGPGAGWQNAISDTHNHIWFVLAVTILPFIPIGLLGGVVVPLFRLWAGTLIGSIATTLWLGAMLLVALTLGAVIASRLYQVIGDRLNTPLR